MYTYNLYLYINLYIYVCMCINILIRCESNEISPTPQVCTYIRICVFLYMNIHPSRICIHIHTQQRRNASKIAGKNSQ